MKNTALAICLLLFSTTCSSQNKRTAELKLNYEFSSTGKTNKVEFIFAIPETIKNVQNVTKIEYMPEPDTTYRVNGTNYVQFTFDSVFGFNEIAIIATIEIAEFDLNSVQNGKSTQLDTISKVNYLHRERFIESDTAIIMSTAERLANKERLKTLKNIYKYIAKEIKYTGYNNADYGAIFAIQTKGGDCSEFSDLFVSLCRANNIPARVVYGYTTEYGFTPRHAWAEAYTNEYGWVRFDPTNGQSMSFGTLQNMYIQLSDIRNDPTLHNEHYSTYQYWGDPIKLKETINISKSLPQY